MGLSCLDSQVPVEDAFNQGIGNVIVGRVAGNFVNEDMTLGVFLKPATFEKSNLMESRPFFD